MIDTTKVSCRHVNIIVVVVIVIVIVVVDRSQRMKRSMCLQGSSECC